jgi:hypothetical protein
MSTTEIREALTEVRDAVDVPVVDRLAFERRVRAQRRRRTAGRVLVVGTVAAGVAVAAAVSGGVGGPDRGRDSGPAHESTAAGGLGETVFFVLDGELSALDPSGRVHDLGVRAEAVVGFTSERVYAVDRDSHLVVRTVSYDDEETRRATFGRAASPVSGAVQTAALSGDGRYLAWTDLDDVSHRYDLKADREDLTVSGGPSTSVVDVGADGLLLSEDGELNLRTAGSVIPIPVQGDGYGVASQVAFGRVLVNDRDDRSRLYDVSDGHAARLVATVTGFGTLGPYAERVASIVTDSSDASRLEVWDGGDGLSLTGLGATPDQLRWADESTLLVAAHRGGESSLYACDIDLACQRLPVDGEVDLNR